MAKNKTPDLPSTPAYQQDPQFRAALSDLTNVGKRLTSFDFTGDLAPLAETIQFNPQILQTFIDTLKGKLTPAYRDTRQDTVNALANIGALESSTAANALQRGESDFLNTLATQAGEFGLAQTMSALENRIRLETLGSNILGQGAQMGQANEQFLNQFNLSNYENQVAQQLYSEQNKAGGWLGALKGGLGGGLVGMGIGAALAPFTAGMSLIPAMAAGFGTGGLVGAGVGAVSPRTTSEQFLKGGLTSASMMAVPRYTPSSSAANDIRLINTGNEYDDLNFNKFRNNLRFGLGS